MNGILHRLAAQAMGSTGTLRSASRTPYAPPHLPINPDEPDRAAATLNTAGNETRQASDGNMKRDSVPGQKPQRGHHHAEIGAQRGTTEVAPPSAAAFVFPPEVAAKTERTSAQPAAEKPVLRQAEKKVNKSLADKPQTGGIEPHISTNAFATGSTDSGEPYTAVTNGNYPPPLLPLKNTAHPAALHANANAAAAAQRAESRIFAYRRQVEETTEVHVSIGRIEVTAVHEPAPAKRQEPAARPMTLDAYLARRRQA